MKKNIYKIKIAAALCTIFAITGCFKRNNQENYAPHADEVVVGDDDDPDKVIKITVSDQRAPRPRPNPLPLEGPLGGFNPYLGPAFTPAPWFIEPEHEKERKHRVDPTDWLLNWNQIAIDAAGLDHTPVPPGDPRVFGEQIGPGRSSRAMAIVHIAIFDALNAILGGYESYTNIARVKDETSIRAAIAQAAHDTLVELYPSQKNKFDSELAEDLSEIDNGETKQNGINLGKKAAKAILDLRDNDGSETKEPKIGIGYIPPVGVGLWSQDPISLSTVALGAFWGQVKPFVMTSGQQFRTPLPPALTSLAYSTAFIETKAVGGDGIITPTIRTPEQTEIGIFWAYDGTPSLCAPPRLYNQLTVHLAKQKHTNSIELARLLALINIGMADAGIAVWDSKYVYNFWRPVTAIRAANLDGNPDTQQDPTFTPFGAPASNLNGPNFTPPFPSYPSGHAGFGGALFEILRKFYGTDDIEFTLTSDEFNGKTKDNAGNVRPLKPRSFKSLSQAEEENGQSRMYLGIHWAFDKTAGITQGNKIGDLVWSKILRPVD